MGPSRSPTRRTVEDPRAARAEPTPATSFSQPKSLQSSPNTGPSVPILPRHLQKRLSESRTEDTKAQLRHLAQQVVTQYTAEAHHHHHASVPSDLASSASSTGGGGEPLYPLPMDRAQAVGPGDFTAAALLDPVMKQPPGGDRKSTASSSSTIVRRRIPSLDRLSEGSAASASEHSWDRAVRRGSQRGSQEANERTWAWGHTTSSLASAASMGDIDLTTMTDWETEWTDPSHPPKKKDRCKHLPWFGKGRRRTHHLLPTTRPSGGKQPPGLPHHHKDHHQKDRPCDGWMCGVCGEIFATWETAQHHEQDHLQQVVAGLGWAPEPVTTHRPHHHHEEEEEDGTPRVKPSATHHSTQPHDLHEDDPHGDDDIARVLLDHGHEGFPSRNAGGEYRHSTTTADLRLRSYDRPTKGILSNAHEKHPIANQSLSKFNFEEEEKVPDDELPDHEDLKRPALTEVKQVMMSDMLRGELPLDTLVPKPRPRTLGAEVRFDTHLHPGDALLGSVAASRSGHPHDDMLLMPDKIRDSIVLADEALVDVCRQAEPLILSPAEREAELELTYLSKDKDYYNMLAHRARERRSNPSNRFRTDQKGVLAKLQNKLVDAYQLVKEGEGKTGVSDQYHRKAKKGEAAAFNIQHNDRTMYVNVMVRNSVQVVRHELERLAHQRWEKPDEAENFSRFERFRVYAHINIVRLAGLALASDFTPRRVAVQLSNDLYRLMTPRLKRRGITIATDIEYRVGPYFVLAVNITAIDWRRLVKATHRDVNLRRARWQLEMESNKEDEEKAPKKTFCQKAFQYVTSCYKMPVYDVLAQIFAWFYHLHWIIYLPICLVSYYSFLGPVIRQFILSSVTDEVFLVVEEKGMEMEIRVCTADKQAAFMLSALRELRAEGQELKKKRQETESQEKGTVLGPLLGPAIKEDAGPAIEPPGFVVPSNLEFVGLELELPVGFRRLRWAILSPQSSFLVEGLYRNEARYENITHGTWNKHSEHIGLPRLPDGVNSDDFVGAEKEGSYLMPKSAFVSANMCYETHFLIAYNDYCFCVKKRARNPDAPFGKTFIAWTQYVIVNKGNNSCQLTCSVEAEFPNGEPMVARQIRSGMRAGTGELFVLTGETIVKYADEFP